MAIVQISKIQQRSGNIVDLPQLDNAELGWASDARRLFVGNDNNITGVENVEVLTSYSTIDFDQINGSAGNLDINGPGLENGQVLTYDGNNWTNRGGNVGGLINLGEVSNIKINGGAIGYVLETDGTGNLSWTPKSTIVAYIQNSTQANPCVITTTEDNFFVDKQQITITDVPGMTQLNGGSYYANVLTSNTFSLYSDFNLTIPVNSSAYGAFPYTSVTATSSTSDQVTVGDATSFTINDPVIFVGNTDSSNSSIIEGQTYYIKTKDTSAPNIWVTLSDTVGGNTLQLGNATFTADLFASGGRVIASVGGAGAIAASGSNTTVQFNNNNIIDGDSDFTWKFSSPKVLTINGNANVSNLNSTTSVVSSRLVSNIATGTAPLTVTSTTRVANLNVSYSNVSDFEVVTAQTTGTFYPVFVSGSSTANYALGANANISFNAATGNLSTTILNANGNANVGNLGTGGLIVSTGNVTGGNLNTAGVLSVTGNANVGNLGTSGLIVATGNITGGNLNTGGLVSATGNVTGGNLNTAGNVTASVLISNVTTGTAPLTVTSTTRVSNLNVSYSNVSDFINISTATTGTFYPVIANALTGNVQESANANLSFNAATGALSATLLTGTLTTAAQPNITSVGTLTSLSVTGNISGANLVGSLANGTSSVTIPAANGNVNISVNGNANVLVTTSTGVNVAGTLNATGNANVGNLGTGGLITATGNVSGGNLTTAGVVAATGNVSGGNLTTAGALAVTGNANVGNIGATGGVFTTVAGTLTTNAQPNITSVGTLTSLIVSGTANLNTALTTLLTTGANTTAGTITGNWTLSTGSQLSATNANTAGTVTTNAQPNITSVGTLTSLGVNGTVTAVAFTANTGVFTGNGSGLSAIAGANVTGTVANATNATSASTAGTVTTNAQPNITSVSTSFTNLTFANAQTISGNNMTLTTGANTNLGTITGNWSLSAGSRLQATYADLAEYYSADALYAPGTVLEFGGEQEVTLGTDGSNKIAGVVSTDPAYAMNAKCPGEFPIAIALQGRVPVKVRGTIRKGDMLVSGGNGFARPSSAPLMGTVIGKSLENFSGTEGIIEIAVGRL